MAAKRSKRISTGAQNKEDATTQPVKLETELVAYWDREFDYTNGYFGLTVEVVSRVNNILTFTVLGEAAKAGKGKSKRKTTTTHEINLDDGTQVWSALPSTAQEIDPESSQKVGYLFVSKPWLELNEPTREPPKWPRTLSI